MGVCGDEVLLEEQEPDGVSTSVGNSARQISSATLRYAPASFAEREPDGRSKPVGWFVWLWGSATAAWNGRIPDAPRGGGRPLGEQEPDAMSAPVG